MYSKQNKIANIESLISDVLHVLGVETTDGVKDTPKRVAKMFVNELFESVGKDLEELDKQMTLFDAENQNKVSVAVPFYSMCEHHLMPFFGTVTVYYYPDKKIIGLSKIPRVVQFFSKKPQLQERLTQEIGEYLVNLLKPKSLGVTIEAEHMCVTMRGIKSPAKTSTSYTYKPTISLYSADGQFLGYTPAPDEIMLMPEPEMHSDVQPFNGGDSDSSET